MLVCMSWLRWWCLCCVSLHVMTVLVASMLCWCTCIHSYTGMVDNLQVLAECVQVFPGLRHLTKFYIPPSSMPTPAAKHKQHGLSLGVWGHWVSP